MRVDEIENSPPKSVLQPNSTSGTQFGQHQRLQRSRCPNLSVHSEEHFNDLTTSQASTNHTTRSEHDNDTLVDVSKFVNCKSCHDHSSNHSAFKKLKKQVSMSTSDSISNSTNPSAQPHVEPEFAACLLIMDDNHYLIEWLAYHFTVLPLKRLIVAIDPHSRTSPIEILRRYENLNISNNESPLINITVWNDADFKRVANLEKIQYEERYDRHLERQDQFISSCLKQLYYERIWRYVAIIDSDEYIAWNNDYDPGFLSSESTPEGGPATIATTMNTIDGRSLFSSYIGLTIAERLQQVEQTRNTTYEVENAPACSAMKRINVAVKESTGDTELVQWGIPASTGFDGNDFNTHRYMYVKKQQRRELLLHQISRNRDLPGKAVINLHSSQINPKKDFKGSSNTNCHRPLLNHCSEDNVWISYEQSQLVVYHYAGTAEQFTFRQGYDGRNTRTLTEYRKRYQIWDDIENLLIIDNNVIVGRAWLKFPQTHSNEHRYQNLHCGVQVHSNANQVDHCISWVGQFVRKVGNIEKARALLRDVGKVLQP